MANTDIGRAAIVRAKVRRMHASRHEFAKHAILILVCLFIILPILFMLSVSVKSLTQVLRPKATTVHVDPDAGH